MIEPTPNNADLSTKTTEQLMQILIIELRRSNLLLQMLTGREVSFSEASK